MLIMISLVSTYCLPTIVYLKIKFGVSSNFTKFYFYINMCGKTKLHISLLKMVTIAIMKTIYALILEDRFRFITII